MKNPLHMDCKELLLGRQVDMMDRHIKIPRERLGKK
jgi:hypothetical protein